MTARRAALTAAVLFLLPAVALGQALPEPDFDSPPTAAIAPPAVPAPKRASSGLCAILKGDQVVEQQNCKALADTADAGAGETFAKGITYVWPSGNRTIVSGSEEDFSVNGNLAVPLPDKDRGLCLKVEKTGNTFCYKEGARMKAAAVPAAATPPALAPAVAAPAAAKAAESPKPVEIKKPDGTAVAGAAITAPAATTSAPSPADQLAEEVKLRKAAEDEIKILKSEIARLNEVEQKRLAVAAEQRRTAEAEEKTKAEKAEADKARVAVLLKELDELKPLCAGGDTGACDKALVRAYEASNVGAFDAVRIGELEQLRKAASAPLGIRALSFVGDVPLSTWAASALAALLAMALMITRRRRPLVAEALNEADDHAPPIPNLDPAPSPSLDPFSVLPPPAPMPAHPLPASPSTPSPFPPVTLDPGAVRATPPPIPTFAAMPALFPQK